MWTPKKRLGQKTAWKPPLRIRGKTSLKDIPISASRPLADGDEPEATEKARKTLTKIHERLRDKSELTKLHLQHYHMTPENFRRRTSSCVFLRISMNLYKKVYQECEQCQAHAQAPQRSKVTGMRATVFGDLWFIDHVEVSYRNVAYIVLVLTDAASNFLWAGSQLNKQNTTTIETLLRAMHELGCNPKAICADSYFMEPPYIQFYNTKGIKTIQLGPNTPWPNRAEAAVKLFKHASLILLEHVTKYKSLPNAVAHVSFEHILRASVYARNSSLTYGGKDANGDRIRT